MIEIKNKTLSGVKFIDLFAGLGGFRLGLESLGAKCVYSNEWDKHAQEVYAKNFGEVPEGDITKVDESTVPNHDILCAGFPCQAFSISGKRRGFEDSRGTLFFDVARIVKEKKPKVVFMENVKNFASHDEGKTLEVVEGTMKELGYTVNHQVLNASDYGVPQKRERIYIVCFRKDLLNTHFVFPPKVPLINRVENLLLEDKKQVEHLYVKRNDIQFGPNVDLNNLVLSNKTVRVGIVNKGGQGERIYSPKGIGVTLSAHGGGVFAKTGGYYIDNRVRKLHVRECARLMGFPDTYEVSIRAAQAYKQFGNSVVVNVIQHIGQQIGETLNKNM